MELVLLASCLNTLLPRLWDKSQEAKKRRERIGNIRPAICRLEAALEDAKFKGERTAGVTELKWEARELCQETRDCIQRFFKNKKADSKHFEEDIEGYKIKIEALCERLDNHSSSGGTVSEKPQYPHVAHPMGLDEPVDELLELVTLPGRPSDGRRKVISIVGFPGLGKTILAKLVYDHDQTSSLVDRARVTAAAKDASEVLREILNQVLPAGEHENLNLDNLTLEKLGQLLATHLQGKRYFIVIDDMQSSEQWIAMKDAFPKDGDGERDGTIIVTTSIQSVADACSSCNGYVYKLSPLDEVKSLDLLLKDRTTSQSRDSAKDHAELILKKCDGLPLAIVSMSQILPGWRSLTNEACEGACTTLGAALVKGGEYFKTLRWVLMNKYTGLNGYALRWCLLYFCMYKAVPRRNSLMRRWEAEGFLEATKSVNRPMHVGAKNLETLVDRNIIQSMEVGTDGAVRRCRPPGMMLEYIAQISMSENFAAVVSDVVEPKTNGIRRLYFRDDSPVDVSKISKMDFSIVLTMAVSGTGCEAILDFKKYELLAVLDLKECTNLEDSHVEAICKLLLLKYLSFGKTIGKVPRAIGDLELLETLEMRTNKTVKVYREVLELPNLKHLLGNFMLIRIWKPKKKLYKFLEKASNLETVTGFVTKTTKGFPKLMCHMRSVRKVKIYCTRDASKEDLKRLPKAIKDFAGEGMNMGGDKRSLSIEFAECPAGTERLASPLEFLEGEGSIGSLKLCGDWRPSQGANSQFRMISGITKLCLSRTTLSWEDVLAGLTDLAALQYLKLDKQVFGDLLIKSDILQSLTRLCLVGGTSKHSITINPEALPALVSLHLIFKAPVFKVEGPTPEAEDQLLSGCLGCLEEIALDSGVDTSVHVAWKNAAKGHPNRPGVVLIQMDTHNPNT